MDDLTAELADRDTEAVSTEDVLTALQIVGLEGLIRDIKTENAIGRSACNNTRRDPPTFILLLLLTLTVGRLADRIRLKEEASHTD